MHKPTEGEYVFLDFANILGLLGLLDKYLIPWAAPSIITGLNAMGLYPVCVTDQKAVAYWMYQLGNEAAEEAFVSGLQLTDGYFQTVKECDPVLLSCITAHPRAFGVSRDRFREYRTRYPESTFQKVAEYDCVLLPTGGGLLYIDGLSRCLRLAPWKPTDGEFMFEELNSVGHLAITEVAEDGDSLRLKWGDTSREQEKELLLHIERFLAPVADTVTLNPSEHTADIRIQFGLESSSLRELVSGLRLRGMRVTENRFRG